MANNNLVTPRMISFRNLEEFINNLKVVIAFDFQWAKEFGVKGKKIGDTFLARKPQRWLVRSGAAYQTQPISDTYATITVDRQRHIGYDWGAFEEVLSIDDAYNRYFETSIRQLANNFDDEASEFAYLNTNNITGTIGTNPASLADSQSLFLTAYAILMENGCPTENLTAVLWPRMAAVVMQYLNTNFNPQGALGEQFRSGQLMSALFGFSRVSVDQNIRSHTVGTYAGTPLVNGAVANGATQIVTDGWTAGDTLLPGDVFSIASVNNVNPKNRRSTGVGKRFVVGGSATLTADGSGNMTIPLGGGMVVYDATQQYANLDVLPADNAALTIFPGTATPSARSGAQSLAFGPQAFACVPIELPKMAGCNIAEIVSDPKTGLSLSLHQGSNIQTYERISRIDYGCGYAAEYPDNEAVRMLGA